MTITPYSQLNTSMCRQSGTRNPPHFTAPEKRRFSRPVIWVKVPKCAGSSLRHLLLKENLLYLVKDPADIPLQTLEKAASSGKVLQIRHGKLHILHKRFPDWVNHAWIFVMVRNPWDRFVSGWRYCPSTRLKHFSKVVKEPPRKDQHLQDFKPVFERIGIPDAELPI